MAGMAVGLRGEVTITVTPDKTAQAIGSGLVPVFATPALIALLETAAVRTRLGQIPRS